MAHLQHYIVSNTYLRKIGFDSLALKASKEENLALKASKEENRDDAEIRNDIKNDKITSNTLSKLVPITRDTIAEYFGRQVSFFVPDDNDSVYACSNNSYNWSLISVGYYRAYPVDAYTHYG